MTAIIRRRTTTIIGKISKIKTKNKKKVQPIVIHNGKVLPVRLAPNLVIPNEELFKDVEIQGVIEKRGDKNELYVLSYKLYDKSEHSEMEKDLGEELLKIQQI